MNTHLGGGVLCDRAARRTTVVVCRVFSDDLQELVRAPELSVLHGIPAEAFSLQCPDEEFKADVLQEFILLDNRYVEKLEALETEHRAVIR